MDLQQLTTDLQSWTNQAIASWKASAVYLFGSLIYKNGTQFGDSSDIDLAIVMPELANALERHRWLEQFSAHKDALETTLLRTLHRLGDEPIVSVVAISKAEIEMDIHKDGHREFFSSNIFRDLSTGVETTGLPNANCRTPTRFMAAAIGFVQKIRNEHFAVSPNGTATLLAHGGIDPLPKRLMRAAAMAAFSTGQSRGPGAEHDVKEGLDLISQHLYQSRSTQPAYTRLQDLLSVRRSARGAHRPVEASDQLLLAELIYDLTLGGAAGGSSSSSGPGSDEPSSPQGKKEQELESPSVFDATADEEKEDSASTAAVRIGMPHGSTTAFFAERFASAFPGVRQTTWFKEPQAVAMRLGALLKPPLVFNDGTPIWWWRGGNLQIERFERLEGGEFLMNYEELAIRRIAAVPAASYHRNFVYVEAAAMPQTGLYRNRRENIEETIAEMGYAFEEYGIYRGRHLIKRSEYDDGAATIDGVLVDTKGASELRVRYITPYNFIIAPVNSPVNNMNFDHVLEDTLNEALRDSAKDAVEKLRVLIKKLPLQVS